MVSLVLSRAALSRGVTLSISGASNENHGSTKESN